MIQVHDVVVVGAGPAGLSVAYTLRRQGLDPLVLEKTAAVGDVWRHHYEGLRLNTGRYFSRLPGNTLPRSVGSWPGKDEVVRMLERFPERGGFTVETGVQVRRVAYEPASRLWHIEAEGREPVAARTVVLATGAAGKPIIPDWPGLSSFTGEILHSSQFKSARDHKGKRVLVVGSGNSGAEIASRLAEHAEVTLSVRTPPYILPKSLWGVPLPAIGLVLRQLPSAIGDRVLATLQRWFVGDLAAFGLPLPQGSLSKKFERTHVTPTLYTPFADDVRAGRLKVVGPIRKVDADVVQVASGINTPDDETLQLRPDLIVAATGFRPGLADLLKVPGVELPVDWPRGNTVSRQALPGLHVIGQVNPLSGQLREIRLESYRVARAVKQELVRQRAAERGGVLASQVGTH